MRASCSLPRLQAEPRRPVLNLETGQSLKQPSCPSFLKDTCFCREQLLRLPRVNLLVMEESPRHLSKPASAGARVAVCLTPRSLLACFLSFSTFFSVGIDPPAATAAEKKPKQDTVLKGLPITELTADEAILHALNRLAYGPRPGDIERIKQT